MRIKPPERGFYNRFFAIYFIYLIIVKFFTFFALTKSS